MDVIQALLANKIFWFALAYYFWIFVYGVLGLGAILGSGLAATGLMTDGRRQISAGIGALCAAVFGFVQPHTYATAFDIALNTLRHVQTDLATGSITPKEAGEGINRAEDLVHFSYAGVSKNQESGPNKN
jgi:hypothetical protein